MNTKKNIFFNVLLSLSQVLFPLITFPYLARTLGPKHLGLINFSESFARYFILIAAVGIPIYGVREIAKKQNNLFERSKTFYEIFLINVISTLILAIFYFFTILFVDKLYLEKELFFWSLLFFITNIFYLEWFFTGMNQFKYVTIRYFIVRLFFVFFVFLYIKNNNDYLNYMKMNVFLNIVIMFLNLIHLKKLVIFNNNIIKIIEIKKHIKPLFYLFLTIFSISMYLFLDTVLLGLLADNESVGYYSSSLKLTKLVIAILGSISAAMFPELVSLYQNKEYLNFNKMIEDCFSIILSIAIPITIIIFGCANEIVFIFFGESFKRSVLPLQITSPMIIIVSMSTIFGFQILSALAKDFEILLSAFAGMIISFIFTYFLVKNYKEIGEAITILITEIVVCFLFIFFSRKLFSIKNFNKITLEILYTSIPYVILILIFKNIVANIFIRLLAISIFSLVWYVITHFIILKNSTIIRYLPNFLQEKNKEMS